MVTIHVLQTKYLSFITVETLSLPSPSRVLALRHVIPVEVGPAPVCYLLSDHQKTQEDVLQC